MKGPLRIAGRLLRRSVRFPGIRPRERGRRLTVRMDTTNRCNLRCSMCPMRLADMDGSRRWHDMDEALFMKIAGQVFPGAWTVGISCGAEPLCNPRFGDCLRILYESDVPVREMVTNGLLMDEAARAAILATPPTTVFVSIDGCRHETHAAIRGGCDLDRVISNASMLVRERNRLGRRIPRLAFSVTLQRGNLSETAGIVELAAETGASAVGTVPLVPYQGLGCMEEAPDTGSPEYRKAVAEASAVAGRLGIVFTESPRASRPAGASCPYIEGWVFIDPDGRVNPCPYWDTSKPLGDLSSQDFDEIVRGGPYASLRRMLASGRLEPPCSGCPELAGTERMELRK